VRNRFFMISSRLLMLGSLPSLAQLLSSPSTSDKSSTPKWTEMFPRTPSRVTTAFGTRRQLSQRHILMPRMAPTPKATTRLRCPRADSSTIWQG
jgi:hypothetical protein